MGNQRSTETVPSFTFPLFHQHKHIHTKCCLLFVEFCRVFFFGNEEGEKRIGFTAYGAPDCRRAASAVSDCRWRECSSQSSPANWRANWASSPTDWRATPAERSPTCTPESCAAFAREGAEKKKMNKPLFHSLSTYHLLKVDQPLVDKGFVALVHHGHILDEQRNKGNQRRRELGEDHPVAAVVSTRIN